jgi:DNA-binding transcriptional regulator YdaS (Cro superfamily)
MKVVTIWKNGTWLVIAIMLLGIISASLTIWIYSQHVYSSREAQVISSTGDIAVLYPQRLAKKIFPHQSAKVTFHQQDFLFPCKAEVVSVNQTMLGRRPILLVRLQLIDHVDGGQITASEKEDDLLPGTPCSVTIDTTVP